MRLGQHFLEQSVGDVNDVYTAALTAYALTRLHSRKVDQALNLLHNMAISRGMQNTETIRKKSQRLLIPYSTKIAKSYVY